MTLWLSRLRLSRRPGNAALAPLLDPPSPGAALSAHHRLVWAAFADGPDRTRDFLWRAEGDGCFTTLSRRPPKANDLFEPPESKTFEPILAVGDRLRFALRANATKDRAGAKASRRVDLVMDLLRAVPPGARAEARLRLAHKAAQAWMERQGVAHGFAVEALAVEDYAAPLLPRPGAPRGARLGLLDLAGIIRVTDPEVLVARLPEGFGRARAFGCGLLLIRRA